MCFDFRLLLLDQNKNVELFRRKEKGTETDFVSSTLNKNFSGELYADCEASRKLIAR